jgi:hypothetical protein
MIRLRFKMQESVYRACARRAGACNRPRLRLSLSLDEGAMLRVGFARS